MFRPPSLLTPQIVPTAAILPQGSRGFCVRAYRALLPPHAPDMLTVRRQVIDGAGTCTLLDSQPCRLLQRRDHIVRIGGHSDHMIVAELDQCVTPGIGLPDAADLGRVDNDGLPGRQFGELMED